MSEKWACYEEIGISIINPRAAMKFIDPDAPLMARIRDFCYSHSSVKEMHDFVGKTLIEHPRIASRMREVILKICPQYKDMIDKIIILI